MRYCTSCGKSYGMDARYCSYCGKPLVDQGTLKHSEATTSGMRKREREKRCPFCNSSGKIDGPMGGEPAVICPICKGRRYNFIPEDWLECTECAGTGEFTFGEGIAYTRKPCPDCNGTGWVPEQEY